MNTFLPFHVKFDSRKLLRLSLITLTLSLVVGGYSQANAEPAKVEVISVPPQEAFYVEKKTPATPSSYNSDSVEGKISETSTTLPRVSNTSKKEHNPVNTAKPNARS